MGDLRGPADGGGSRRESLEDQVQHILEEARMVLPGIQALFGFQLIAVFNSTFAQLGARERGLHLVAIALVALAVALVMSPAADHRQSAPRTVSAAFVRRATRFLTLGMIPLALGIALDFYLICTIILGDTGWSVAAAAAVLAVFVGLWFVFPRFVRRN
jgi:hypothetical protein